VRLTDEVDRLYTVALEDFCPQRDALAKRLRAAGDRAGARAVLSLRKPTQAAWLVNRVVRAEPALAEVLLRCGSALREAQARVLAGEGAEMLHEAAGGERRAVDGLVAAARGFLPSGRLASETVLERVRETLHAAARDDEVRERVRNGRLDREASAAGWPQP
jgi:hypothetical protein